MVIVRGSSDGSQNNACGVYGAFAVRVAVGVVFDDVPYGDARVACGIVDEGQLRVGHAVRWLL